MVIDESKPTFYKVLGITEEATPLEIKRTYRTLVMKYHPDGTNPDPEKFKEFSKAYSTLDDPVKRAEYDRELRFHHIPHSSTKHSLSESEPVPKQKKSNREEIEDIDTYIKDHQYKKPPKPKPAQPGPDLSQVQRDSLENLHRVWDKMQAGSLSDQKQPTPLQARQTNVVLSSVTTQQGQPIIRSSLTPRQTPATPVLPKRKVGGIIATIVGWTALGAVGLVAAPFVIAGIILAVGFLVIGWLWLFVYCFPLWLLVTIVGGFIGYVVAEEYL